MAVFLFHGQEEYLIDKEIKRLKTELLDASFMSMAYKVFYNPPFQDLITCLQGAPLMFGSTLSVIHFDKYLVGAKMSLDDKQIEVVNSALSSLSDKVNIVFLCKLPRDENKKPDSRKKLYKTIAKYAQVREFPQFKSYQKELNAQLIKMAKEKDLILSSADAALMIEHSGVNLTLFDSEFEKLKTALYPDKVINKDAIKKYCTSSDDVFVLADLIIAGNKNEVLKQLSLLCEKRHPLEIFSVLQSNFQRFIYIKNYEKKMNAKEIAANLKLHEYIVMKTIEKLRKVSLSDLIEIRKNLINAEYKMKTGHAASNEIIMETAILR